MYLYTYKWCVFVQVYFTLLSVLKKKKKDLFRKKKINLINNVLIPIALNSNGYSSFFPVNNYILDSERNEGYISWFYNDVFSFYVCTQKFNQKEERSDFFNHSLFFR